MNIDVELLDLGDDAGEEAMISEWYVEEGDRVEQGQVIVEVISNDNTYDVRAPASGILIERIIEEEETARVGEVLAVIEICDETADAQDEEEEEEEQ